MKRIPLTIACAHWLVYTGTVAALAQQTGSTGKTTAALRPAPLEGEWSGVLQVGETQLHLVLHLTKDARGEWHVVVDSLDQAVFGGGL